MHAAFAKDGKRGAAQGGGRRQFASTQTAESDKLLEHELNDSLEIKLIAEDSTDDDIDEQRKGQPVQCGQNVYLPISIGENLINLPNCIVRSAVFGTRTGGELQANQIVGSHKQYTIKMAGWPLDAYDRRVFAACLEFYQESTTSRKSAKRAPRPLASTVDEGWIERSYWKLAHAMGRSSGPNVASAIQASLVRLNSARLQISWGKNSLPAMPLVEVQFEDGHDYPPTTEDPRVGDTILFRVIDRFAYLYVLGGAHALTTIDKSGLKKYRQGLASWLACYYSSHRQPFTTHIENLRTYCGATCKPNEFRRRLKNALTEFQSSETPNQFRISRFEMTKTEVTVHLARWKS